MEHILALAIVFLFLTIVSSYLAIGMLTILFLGMTIFMFLSYYVTARHDAGF